MDIYENNNLSNEDEFITFVWLKDLPSKKIKELMNDFSDYLKVASYENNIIPRLINEIGADIAFSFYPDSNERYIDQSIRMSIESYFKKLINISREEYSKYNHDVLRQLEINDNTIVFISSLLPLVILRGREDRLLDRREVESISWCLNEEFQAEIEIVENQTKVNKLRDKNNMTQYGLKGRNIKIGVIEKLDLSNKIKSENHIRSVLFAINGKKEKGINGMQCEGVVPLAKVDIAMTYNVSEFNANLESLILSNNRIINMSAGISKEKYSDLDKSIDMLTYRYKVYFIKSAGNKEVITAPGNSVNSIVVGNVETKDIRGIELRKPFNMRSTSGFKQPIKLFNKPEICAPGTNIYFPGLNNLISGTSFAAPIVSGGIAQILEDNYSLCLNPLVIKGAVMMSANANIITGDTNILDTKWLKEKSGAGIFDAVSFYKLITKMHYKEYTFFKNSKSIFFDLGTIKKGTRLKVVLIHNNPGLYTGDDEKFHIDDLDLHLFDMHRNLVDSSISYNNFEYIDIFLQNTMKYYIEVRPYDVRCDEDNSVEVCVLWNLI